MRHELNHLGSNFIENNSVLLIIIIEKIEEELKTVAFSLTYRSILFFLVHFATNVNYTNFLCSYCKLFSINQYKLLK